MARTGIRALLAAVEASNATNLQSTDGFKILSEKQKQLILEHVHHPELTKSELAHKTGISRTDVYDFFASPQWVDVNNAMAKQQVKELIQLAVHTLRKSMLFGRGTVALEAATRVLISAKIIEPRSGPTTVKEDNKIVVMWGQEAERASMVSNDTLEPSAGGESKAPPTNGDHTPLLTAP